FIPDAFPFPRAVLRNRWTSRVRSGALLCPGRHGDAVGRPALQDKPPLDRVATRRGGPGGEDDHVRRSADRRAFRSPTPRASGGGAPPPPRPRAAPRKPPPPPGRRLPRPPPRPPPPPGG